MKILQVIPSFNVGGAERMCEMLSYELSNLGHEVIIISLFSYHSEISERLEARNFPIYFLDKKPGLDIKIIGRLRKIVKEVKPDVIHSHLDLLKYLVPAVKKFNISVVHTVHNIAQNEAQGITHKINKYFYKKRYAYPVALTPYLQSTIAEYYKLSKDDIRIVYNGIDLRRCIPKQDYTAHSQFSILHIGRFAEQKNHIGLINAFKTFSKRYPDSCLTLLGGGDLKPEIEAYVERNGLSEKVIFGGVVEDVFSYLHNADLFILPSLYEGMPITLVEAMGCGTPIIATAVGGVPDMLENEKTAWLVKDTTEESLVKAMEDAYLNKDKREVFGKAALCESEKFSSMNMASQYINIYENVKGR